MVRRKKEIDPRALAKYFSYGFIPAPATIFKGVKKPISKYGRLDYSKKLEDWSEKQIKQEVVKLLKRAVKKSLVADESLGVFLSGGIDSGLVAAIMSKFITPAEIQAFSLGFEEKEFDESIWAQVIAKHLGIKHEVRIFSQKDAPQYLLEIVEFLDEPMADPSLLPTYYLARLARKKIKIALFGDGGDESFAGYPKHLAHWFLEKTRLGRLPLASLARFFSGKKRVFFRYASYPLHLRNQLWISLFSPKEIGELTGIKVSFDDLERYHRLFNGQDPLDEGFFLDQTLTLPDLYVAKTDTVSAATALEIRAPFLDKKLVEFCTEIPFGMKLRGWQTKSLLRKIALDYLPREVVVRPKIGFGFPLSQWLQGSLKPLVQKELLPAKIRKEGILNPKMVEWVCKRGTAHQIWALLIFELWQKRWLQN